MPTSEVTLLIACIALVITVIGAVWKFGQQIGSLTTEVASMGRKLDQLDGRVGRLEGANHGN